MKTLGLYKTAVAAVVFGTIIVQYSVGAANPGFNPVNFFSFFTIESNIFAATIFAVTGLYYLSGGKKDGRIALLRGAATLYMTITGIVYSLLLSGDHSLQITLPWVNFILHYLFPLVAFADWFIDRPAKTISFRQSLVWLIFPVAYLSYSLVRGVYTGWYPYPFLNPAHGGYWRVAFVATCITLGAVLLCALLARVTPAHTPHKKRSAKAA